jgi:hypothetical protein
MGGEFENGKTHLLPVLYKSVCIVQFEYAILRIC